MSSLPSPLKSPVSGVSPAGANQSCHLTAVPVNPVPDEVATYTSPVLPCVNVAMSSLPSPEKSVGEPPYKVGAALPYTSARSMLITALDDAGFFWPVTRTRNVCRPYGRGGLRELRGSPARGGPEESTFCSGP